MVNRVVEQQSSASNQILMPLPSDMPSCSGTSADQPPLPVMPDLVNSTINQEVGVGVGDLDRGPRPRIFSPFQILKKFEQ